LREFSVEGINTTVPLHETILNHDAFIKGDLSTDYLERFNMLDVMRREYRDMCNRNASLAVAGMLLQSEFINRTGGDLAHMKKRERTSRWKNLGRSGSGI
jgi:acetyl-CoA/propionyl-CoA carboxylase